MSKTGIVELLEAGLRAEALRQKTVANNIANQQTPGYRRLDVKFEELLSKAIESGKESDFKKLAAEIYQPKNTAVKPNGNDVSLEVEIGEMVKNSLRQKAFVRILNKIYSQIDDAINLK
jgi:flagellar basal-body rod protein FlgB